MRKKADAEWGIGKITALILLLFIIALVIFGIFTNAFEPAKKRLVAFYDWVLSLFGKGKGVLGDCSIKENMFVYKDSAGNEIKGKLTLCPEECKVDLNDGKGSYRFFSEELNNPRLWVYEELYVVKLASGGPIPISAGVSLTFDIVYFRFNKVAEEWEWSGDKKYWTLVSTDLPRYSKKPNQGIMKNFVDLLKDEGLESGVSFFKSRLNSQSVFTIKDWAEIDHEVTPPFKTGDDELKALYDTLMEKKEGGITISFESKSYNTWFDEYAGLAVDLGNEYWKDPTVVAKRTIEEEFKDVKNSYVIEFHQSIAYFEGKNILSPRYLIFKDGAWYNYNYKTGTSLIADDFAGLNYLRGIRKIASFMQYIDDGIYVQSYFVDNPKEITRIMTFVGKEGVDSEEEIRKLAEYTELKKPVAEDKGCYAYGRYNTNKDNLRLYNTKTRFDKDGNYDTGRGVCSGFFNTVVDKSVEIKDSNREWVNNLANAFETALKNIEIEYKGQKYSLDIHTEDNVAILKISNGPYAVDDNGGLWEWKNNKWELQEDYTSLSDKGFEKLKTNKEIKTWLQDNCK